MECCICYQTPQPNTCFYTTSCNHVLCLSCLIKINYDKCPYCRQEMKEIPDNIKKLFPRNKNNLNYVYITDDRLNHLDFEIINVLNQIKIISRIQYENIVNGIINGQVYDIVYLRDFYQDLYREFSNINRVNNYTNFN